MALILFVGLPLAVLFGMAISSGQAQRNQAPVTIVVGQPQNQGGGLLSALLGIGIFGLMVFYLANFLTTGY